VSNEHPEALRLAAVLPQFGGATCVQAAYELRRLHALNAELLDALRWIDRRCHALYTDEPLNDRHREMAHDAGACARSAISNVEAVQ
jgi:hypothetical protein